MKKISIILLFLLSGCYTPSKEEIQLKDTMMKDKLKAQDSLFNKN
jgi:hypothetical protein